MGRNSGQYNYVYLPTPTDQLCSIGAELPPPSHSMYKFITKFMVLTISCPPDTADGLVEGLLHLVPTLIQRACQSAVNKPLHLSEKESAVRVKVAV